MATTKAPFVHGRFYRTKPCFYQLFNIKCSKGDKCSFSHDPELLKTVMTEYRRLKPCHTELAQPKSCRYGDSCRYTHGPNSKDQFKIIYDRVIDWKIRGSDDSLIHRHTLHADHCCELLGRKVLKLLLLSHPQRMQHGVHLLRTYAKPSLLRIAALHKIRQLPERFSAISAFRRVKRKRLQLPIPLQQTERQEIASLGLVFSAAFRTSTARGQALANPCWSSMMLVQYATWMKLVPPGNSLR